MRGRRSEEHVVEVTTASQSRAEEISGRQRRYVISMIIRTLCFIGAVLVGPGWLRWALIFGAVFLPYIAVVAANAGAELRRGEPEAVVFDPLDPDRRELPPGRS